MLRRQHIVPEIRIALKYHLICFMKFIKPLTHKDFYFKYKYLQKLIKYADFKINLHTFSLIYFKLHYKIVFYNYIHTTNIQYTFRHRK